MTLYISRTVGGGTEEHKNFFFFFNLSNILILAFKKFSFFDLVFIVSNFQKQIVK